MASLKILCALQVHKKTEISELDEYVSKLSEFIKNGEDGVFDGVNVNYNDFVRVLFGWTYHEVTNGSEKFTFFLDREYNLCGKRAEFSGKTATSVCWYVKGKKDGLETVMYPCGAPSRETWWKNGKKHGLETEWYHNGSLSFRTNYKDGLRHGDCEIYGVSERNKLCYIVKFENDLAQ
ncbi:hypothetical protein [Brazilian marseillevirus]|uniref:hypothetical protein n=1 Tax=Brazilian marseillevirus TaxID=1813599 RepID=UPI0007803544|nr:hypothetical protein A3303_gp129 [Brazilian marseillevirus]AMQ10637.1 hypothetical protein [Brazilian marseillevirus]